MFESDLEDNTFRRRLMKEVAAGIPVHFSFYSPMVKVQVQDSAEHLCGANGRYIGDGVTIEFVPEDAAAVERVREFVWCWEEYNEFTAVRKVDHLRRGADPGSVQGILERARGVDKRAAAKAAEAVEPDELKELIEAEDAKTLARLPGLGEKRAHAVVEFYRNEWSPPVFSTPPTATTASGGLRSLRSWTSKGTSKSRSSPTPPGPRLWGTRTLSGRTSRLVTLRSATRTYRIPCR